MYLKSSFQNKIIKNLISKTTKFHKIKAIANCDFANCIHLVIKCILKRMINVRTGLPPTTH